MGELVGVCVRIFVGDGDGASVDTGVVVCVGVGVGEFVRGGEKDAVAKGAGYDC